MRKLILILTLAMCAVLAGTLAGCGRSAENAASNAVSGVGSAIAEGASRLESSLRPGTSESSRRPASSGYYSSGTVDSGTDGVIGNGDRELGRENSGSSYVNSQERSAVAKESSAARVGENG